MTRVRRPPRARHMPAGHVLLVGVIAMVLGLFLNADSLYHRAQGMEYGWRRTIAVDVMRPIHAVANALALDRPRRWVEAALGRDTGSGGGGSTVVAAASSSTIPAEDAVTTTTEPPVSLRLPTAENPLQLWVGGDSMSQVFGQSLVRMCVDRGTIAATLDYRISTGLSRPDYFDWPAHLQNDVLTTHPEVIVIMFGANDSQPLNVDGTVRNSSDPEWQAEYRRRVAAVMDQLRGDGRLVIWVGQPVMRDSGFSERMGRLDEIYSSEAKTRPWIRFLDTRPLFAGSDGGYSAYLPAPDGSQELMRQTDGIHLTRAGGDRLASAVLGLLDTELATFATASPTTTTIS